MPGRSSDSRMWSPPASPVSSMRTGAAPFARDASSSTTMLDRFGDRPVRGSRRPAPSGLAPCACLRAPPLFVRVPASCSSRGPRMVNVQARRRPVMTVRPASGAAPDRLHAPSLIGRCPAARPASRSSAALPARSRRRPRLCRSRPARHRRRRARRPRPPTARPPALPACTFSNELCQSVRSGRTPLRRRPARARVSRNRSRMPVM